MQVACYRLGDLLIDAGVPHGVDLLVDALRDDPPARIVCTHQHEDHIGAIAGLRRVNPSLAVYVPRMHTELVSQGYDVPRYRREAWGCPEAAGPVIGYDDGARFTAAGLTLEAVETPGHTPGHMALVTEVDGVPWVFSGDLFLSKRPQHAFYESSAPDCEASCRKLAAAFPGLRLIPAHGRVREDGEGALLALADWMAQVQERVRVAAAEIGTDDPHSVAALVFGDDPMHVFSDGEASAANLVRAVLDPVRSLPAQHI